MASVSTSPPSSMAVPASAWTLSSWIHQLWQDLQPTPGRLNGSLRIVLATVLALLFMLVLQMPFASIGLYFVFLIGRDSPSVSLRSGVFSVVTLAFAIAVELAVVILSDNDPMARLLGVAVVSFIAGMFMLATTLPSLASTWGFIFCTVIALWENPAPPDALVKLSLWLVAAAATAVVCSVSVEYVFASKDPAGQIQEQRRLRYQALELMFTAYAKGAQPAELAEALVRVQRLAVVGQSGMQHLYNQIVDRNLATGKLPVGARVRITMLAQLMDVAAAFGSHQLNADDPALRERCARIAQECHAVLLEDVTARSSAHIQLEWGPNPTLLDRVEGVLHTIMAMPAGVARNETLVALPSHKVPILIPGALQKKETVAFALKISLCATLCYIIYHAVDWPGISTSVTTVLITGLSSSAAIKQKLIFRLLGSIIGGLILGLGATSFLFPHMDSITSLVVLIVFVSFGAAWWTSGRQFGYIGLQIAFSFYLVTFEGFSAPTELAPARDRLIGIVLALVVMAFVFDQLWPVRTITAMRQAFASVLRGEASLFRLFDANRQRDDLLRQADALRDHAGKTVAGMRSMDDVVQYEFGVDREQHLLASETILRAALIAVALFWNQLVVLHSDEDRDFLTEPSLIDMRLKLAERLDAIAEAVVRKCPIPSDDLTTLVDPALLQSPRFGEYARNAIGRYAELQAMLATLSLQV
jgi:multidrug resistance protein MdtO